MGLTPPESPGNLKKKRKTSTPVQSSPAVSDLVPPQPSSGFKETVIASNPFDDSLPVSNQQQYIPQSHPMMNIMNVNMNMGMNIPNKHIGMNSGKIYPVDQPMVFNPQNPNAPPIYPCGICHKEVHDNDQAILCESGCNFWFHRICTGLAEPAYCFLTQEVYAEWVCDRCLSTKNVPLVKFKP